MKKLSIAILMLIMALPVFADIVLSKSTGMVEVMMPGKSNWEKPETGLILPPDSRISTGFNSSATLLINGSSEVTVKALTRLKVEDAAGQAGTGDQSTRLFMGSGRINASVKKNEGSIHDFQVRTPVSTAAVRGTNFDFAPGRLKVKEGVVVMSVGRYRFSVSRGQNLIVTTVNGEVVLLSPIQNSLNSRIVSTNTKADTGSEDSATETKTDSQSGKTGYALISLE